MSGKENLTNVAYAKANWARYLLGGILVALVVAISMMFAKTFENARSIRGEIDETNILDKNKPEEDDEATGDY